MTAAMTMRAGRLPAGRTGIPNAVLAVSMIIFTEIMFFAALLSAYFVARTYTSTWPPLGQPRLPLAVTALNTAVLLASGACAWLSLRKGAGARLPHLLALAGGVLFVLIQGAEWTRLIRFGLTLASGSYGSFFYLLIGAHALHALAGIGALAALVPAARSGSGSVPVRGGKPPESARKAAILYWLFVVGMWPLLYVLVYLV